MQDRKLINLELKNCGFDVSFSENFETKILSIYIKSYNDDDMHDDTLLPKERERFVNFLNLLSHAQWFTHLSIQTTLAEEHYILITKAITENRLHFTSISIGCFTYDSNINQEKNIVISPSILQSFIESLKNNNKIQSVELVNITSNNNYCVAMHFSDVLKYNNTIQSLSLIHTNVTSEGVMLEKIKQAIL